MIALMLSLQSALVSQYRSCIFHPLKGTGFIFITYGYQSDWCNDVQTVQVDVSSRDFLLILQFIS